MRFPLLTAAILSLAAIIPSAAPSASADQADGGQVYVKVEHLTTSMDGVLSSEAQEQLKRSGVASGKSMLGARVNLAAGVASGKTTVLDSYKLTIPLSVAVRFAPKWDQIGVKVALTPEAASQDLNANIELSYLGRTMKKTLVAPHDQPTAWLLNPDAKVPAETVHLALLTFTRVPSRAAE